MQTSENEPKTAKKSPNRTKRKLKASKTNDSSVSEIPHCSKTETNLSLPGVW